MRMLGGPRRGDQKRIVAPFKNPEQTAPETRVPFGDVASNPVEKTSSSEQAKNLCPVVSMSVYPFASSTRLASLELEHPKNETETIATKISFFIFKSFCCGENKIFRLTTHINPHRACCIAVVREWVMMVG